MFKIRKEERKGALVALLVALMLNILNIVRYAGDLSVKSGDTWSLFVRTWHLSGFDPITYAVITDWRVGYNIYRHPLLPYFMWPFTKINEGLTWLTGYNCVMFVTAVLLIFCSVYSFVFLNRIFTEIIGIKRREGYILSALTFSFAYIMLATFAPDHFIMSMCCLLATLYIFGRTPLQQKVKGQRSKVEGGSKFFTLHSSPFTFNYSLLNACLLFVVTAGVTLSNGLKVIAVVFLAKGKKFFPYYFIALLAFSGMVWGSARLTYHYLVRPTEVAKKEKAAKNREAQLERLVAKYGESKRDSIKNKLEEKRTRRFHMSAVYKHTGKPIAKGEFMRWTDGTTNRWDVVVECLFGEGIMLHEDYLLKDVLVNRPVIVRYINWFNYIVEALLVSLFAAGIWIGRKSRFLWICLACFAIDMALHLGLGFGINEMAIMSAHYLWVLPIAMAYLLKHAGIKRAILSSIITVIAIYLVIWNVVLTIEYMYFL